MKKLLTTSLLLITTVLSIFLLSSCNNDTKEATNDYTKHYEEWILKDMDYVEEQLDKLGIKYEDHYNNKVLRLDGEQSFFGLDGFIVDLAFNPDVEGYPLTKYEIKKQYEAEDKELADEELAKINNKAKEIYQKPDPNNEKQRQDDRTLYVNDVNEELTFVSSLTDYDNSDMCMITALYAIFDVELFNEFMESIK